MELSKETKERIEKQSYEACYYATHRAGYIVGAEVEALRSQQLVEALEELLPYLKAAGTNGSHWVPKIESVLHQYNNLK